MLEYFVNLISILFAKLCKTRTCPGSSKSSYLVSQNGSSTLLSQAKWCTSVSWINANKLPLVYLIEWEYRHECVIFVWVRYRVYLIPIVVFVPFTPFVATCGEFIDIIEGTTCGAPNLIDGSQFPGQCAGDVVVELTTAHAEYSAVVLMADTCSGLDYDTFLILYEDESNVWLYTLGIIQSVSIPAKNVDSAKVRF